MIRWWDIISLPQKSNELYVKNFFLIIFLSINEESVVVNIFILIVPFIKVAGESDTCGWIWKRRFKCSNRGKVIEWLRSRIQNIKVYDDVDIESGSWLVVVDPCDTLTAFWPRLDYLQSRLLEKVNEWDERNFGYWN